ncbi:Sulfate adenylyltransferase [bacterium HR24]|nr:Sulfate adenylyltransferase [bacterium HR24]
MSSIPHGGKLVSRVLPPERRAEAEERIRSLPVVRLDARQLSDLQMIAQGAFSPLEGFLCREDYRNVLRHMRLADGTVWSLPITLAVDAESARSLKEGQEVALAAPDGQSVGLLELEEVFPYDKEEEAQSVFRTTDPAHPGVQALLQRGDVLLGGKVWALELARGEGPFGPYWLTPAETRAEFARRGWRTVVGFQTRNPIHRAHEYLQKCALEMVDGLLVHPLVGETKADDIPAEVRLRCYEALLGGYYPRERVLLAVFPAYMRYAGPREAIFHALCRKNYGCTHFIVGRDHAGVGSYYGPYDAQHIFREFAPEELGITPLFFENAFYCRRCGGMASAKTCPHPPEDQVNLSGTQVRAMLARGELPPPEFTRPEVARLLLEAASGQKAQGR